MYYALTVYSDLNIFRFHVKEEGGFNHFQPLVRKGSAVDSNFLSHFPGRMVQGFAYCNILQVHPVNKWASGSCYYQGLGLVSLKKVIDCRVFAVYRNDPYILFFGITKDPASSHDHRFLIGKGQVYAAIYGCNGSK